MRNNFALTVIWKNVETDLTVCFLGIFMTKVYTIGRIYSICDYPPYRGGTNPKINPDTYRIMDFKNPDHHKHKSTVSHFGKLLNGGFERIAIYLETKDLQVAIVPSSKKGKISKGLEGVIECVSNARLTYNRDFLVRINDVPAAHEGGDRSIEKHYKSIVVKCIPNPNVPLILLDDVTTTGNSLEACRAILEKVGVKQVFMVAIGRTLKL
jgi:hypothetical protein